MDTMKDAWCDTIDWLKKWGGLFAACIFLAWLLGTPTLSESSTGGFIGRFLAVYFALGYYKTRNKQ